MLQSNHLLDGSGNWDTNWVRKFLKIPQDQLNRIANIAEWSTHKILTTDNTVGKGVCATTTEKQQLHQNAALEKLGQSNSSEKVIDNPKVSNLLQTSESKLLTFSTENKLSRSASLTSLSLYDKPLDRIILRSANSAPDIKVLSSDLSSVEHHTISVADLQKSKVSKLYRPKINPSEERLNNTFTTLPKLKEMDQTSFSQPEMSCKRSPKTPLARLADRIRNHKHLKGAEREEVEACKELLNKGIQYALDNHTNLRKKKVPPSGKCSVSIEGNSKQGSHFGNSGSQKLPKPILQTLKDAKLPQMQDNEPNAVSEACDMLNENHAKKDTSVSQNSVQDSDINVSQDKQEKDVKSSTLSVNHEESFGSQLIPCGQPLPKDANLSKKASIEMLDKSAHIVTNVPASAENSRRSVTETSPIADVRSSGTKRKRKSKTNSPKKSKYGQNVDIHFTADQLRNMLEIMKMFHSEV